ncbi:MAG: hypothetical protein ACFFB5_20655 [Promethearchaeota archaeon]
MNSIGMISTPNCPPEKFIIESGTVITEEGQNLARELGVSYYESNLTDKKTIDTIFYDLAIKVLQKQVFIYRSELT